MKSRRQLREQGLPARGLDGGRDDVISFTNEEQIARQIAEQMQENTAYARGDKGLRDLIHSARAGEGANRPWLPPSHRGWERFIETGAEEDMPVYVRELLAHPRDYSPETIKRIERNPDHVADTTLGLLEEFRPYREMAEGPAAPVFWNINSREWRERDPRDFGYLEYDVPQDALVEGDNSGKDMLREYRIQDGSRARLVAPHYVATM